MSSIRGVALVGLLLTLLGPRTTVAQPYEEPGAWNHGYSTGYDTCKAEGRIALPIRYGAGTPGDDFNSGFIGGCEAGFHDGQHERGYASGLAACALTPPLDNLSPTADPYYATGWTQGCSEARRRIGFQDPQTDGGFQAPSDGRSNPVIELHSHAVGRGNLVDWVQGPALLWGKYVMLRGPGAGAEDEQQPSEVQWDGGYVSFLDRDVPPNSTYAYEVELRGELTTNESELITPDGARSPEVLVSRDAAPQQPLPEARIVDTSVEGTRDQPQNLLAEPLDEGLFLSWDPPVERRADTPFYTVLRGSDPGHLSQEVGWVHELYYLDRSAPDSAPRFYAVVVQGEDHHGHLSRVVRVSPNDVVVSPTPDPNASAGASCQSDAVPDYSKAQAGCPGFALPTPVSTLAPTARPQGTVGPTLNGVDCGSELYTDLAKAQAGCWGQTSATPATLLTSTQAPAATSQPTLAPTSTPRPTATATVPATPAPVATSTPLPTPSVDCSSELIPNYIKRQGGCPPT